MTQFALSVVKVGGSLLANGARLRAVLAGLADGRDGPAVVVVPGGGPFAEVIREAQRALGFDDALAHRLALDAMGRMAEVFSALEPRLRLAPDIDAIHSAVGNGRTALWDPAALRTGHPDIAESWDVTSDSLALWLATTLRAVRCVLLKAAPCPADAEPEALVRLGLVDRSFPTFAKTFAGKIVLRGPDGEASVVGGGDRQGFSPPTPHPEMPRSGLEGGLQGSRRLLEPSSEARLCLAPHDEDEGNADGEECLRRTVGDAA